MKKTAMFLLASLAIGVAGQASAQTSGLTRAEVRQQLVQAEAQGQLPSSGVDYPPSSAAMARNKAAFQAREQAHASATGYGGATDGQTSN
ncbi:hypothetical protein AWB80_03866 [Caballeronia pedi]|uniref:Purine nucleoside phosphorylase n=1 Tax=Caballeronia pedi TaxID=1777141 RepID=A0A158BP23_9BURK|nr:DUF4148 domain-containing protein [Caballeronia pedi]SAK71842.1 hypothetical protein AWB80_03866 [Caballeronia pedi]